MKTDELVNLLAATAVPVAGPRVMQRFLLTLACGLIGAFALMALTFGLRADFGQALLQPILWIKFAFAGSLAATGLVLVQRLGRPGMRLGAALFAPLVPIALIWTYAATELLASEPSARPALIFGATWAGCPFNIALLAAPVFVAAIVAIRSLAPTRLVAAGAGAGLLAGAAGALIYALHCPETGAPFVASWYAVGIALCTLFGAALGPRLLRW
jgi:hypothetical protein